MELLWWLLLAPELGAWLNLAKIFPTHKYLFGKLKIHFL